ncbi:MAG: hypothetical protein ABFD90_09065 [Phycisphaerales bacterium]
MIRTGRSTVVFVLAALLACSSLAGTEPAGDNAPLTFEVSSMEWPAPDLTYSRPSGGNEIPWKGTVAYVAGIPHRKDALIPSDAMSLLFSHAQGLDISEKQRVFLGGLDAAIDAEMGRLNTKGRYTPPEDPNSVQVMLYAVSLEDAKRMAQWYVQHERDSFRQQVAYHQACIKETTEAVAGIQRKLSDLSEAEETAKKAMDEVKKRVPYRSAQQALDAAVELDKMLNAAQVEIAGVQATLKAIQDRTKPMASLNLPLDLRAKLEMMFVEQSISLQAAEARKRMATELRKQADAYMDLMQTLSSVTGEKEALANDLADKSEYLQAAQNQYPSLLQREPKVIDNKVFIYPVK